MTRESDQQTGYFIDPELMPEMVRLLQQAHTLTRSMQGELFSAGIPIPRLHDILDVACGPGGWALDVAERYPNIRITGFDKSERMIEYAQVQAQEKNLSNAHFLLMDALETLPFPDSSFDLVNSRFIVGFMQRDVWPRLIQECTRILRPGGVLSLTEADTTTIIGGPTYIELGEIIVKALWQSKQSFLSERSIGITPMLRPFLEGNGYQSLEQVAHVIDFSSGTFAHDDVIQDFLASFQLLQPFLIKTNIITQAQFDELYQRAQHEAQAQDFRAVWYVLNVYGTKPL